MATRINSCPSSKGSISTPLHHTAHLSFSETKECQQHKNVHTNVDPRLHRGPLSQPEGTIDSDDENTVHAILMSNSPMRPEIIHTSATPPMSPDDAPAGNLAFTLPADGFPEVQGWTKSGTAINLSNLVERS
ncbi:hypothetical protein ARMGADRAFT_1075670 [Armillaria gallica]|uniref:Uncharacterized protein n=1 Tax=Armillaria gallica TaxID=47427 RepID=A0A2H3E718_ARMGA|nr:hypothetical protein ARMGADRAFT_1075670 [Armillaria gallica]